MSYEITGIVHRIGQIEQKTESFTALEFSIKTEGQYPQFVGFQAVQDRTGIVNGLKEGDKITVSFDLRGREWNDKVFTNLNAWKVVKVGQEVATQTQTEGQPPF